MKEGRRREETSRARKESEQYLQQVEKGKKIQQITQRKDKRKREEMDIEEKGHNAERSFSHTEDRSGERAAPSRVMRTFYQRPVVPSKSLDQL